MFCRRSQKSPSRAHSRLRKSLSLQRRSMEALAPNLYRRRQRRKWPAPISRWQNTDVIVPASVTVGPALLDRIEVLRQYCGRPVIITSGVRCEGRNTEVGGVAWSFHKRGDAADLYCPGVAVGDLAQTAKELGMNVLPYYASGYIHVEV